MCHRLNNLGHFTYSFFQLLTH